MAFYGLRVTRKVYLQLYIYIYTLFYYNYLYLVLILILVFLLYTLFNEQDHKHHTCHFI